MKATDFPGELTAAFLIRVSYKGTNLRPIISFAIILQHPGNFIVTSRAMAESYNVKDKKHSSCINNDMIN